MDRDPIVIPASGDPDAAVAIALAEDIVHKSYVVGQAHMCSCGHTLNIHDSTTGCPCGCTVKLQGKFRDPEKMTTTCVCGHEPGMHYFASLGLAAGCNGCKTCKGYTRPGSIPTPPAYTPPAGSRMCLCGHPFQSHAYGGQCLVVLSNSVHSRCGCGGFIEDNGEEPSNL